MAKDIIKELLLKTKNDLETARKQEVRDRKDIYYDNWTTILKTEIDNQFSKKTRGNVKQMIALDSNVLKRIVKEISVVYQESAKRVYLIGEGDTAKEDENYNELLKNMPVNLTMQEVNRLTNLCNETLVYIVPRHDKIEYDILTPDIVEVYQSMTNAKEIEAIVFTQSFVDTRGDTTLYYIYWDIHGNHLKFDADLDPVRIKGNEKGKNPYIDPDNKGQTILPFEIFHKDFPIDSIWNVTGGEDLVNGTKQIGVLLTYLNYLIKVTTFKQKFFQGISIKDVPQNLVHDPLFSLVVPNAEGKIGVIDYQILLDKLWELIYAKIGAMANNYGLSLDNFKLIGSAQSGYALKIKNLGLDKIVNEQIKLYRWHEGSLFEKTKIVNNTMYSGSKIADNGVFKIDFAEQEYPESPEDIRRQWEFDIKLGAKSIADYAMYVNPDLKTKDEAVAYINKNVSINKQIAEDTGITMALIEKAFAREGDDANTE